MKYKVGDKVRIKIKPKFVKFIKGIHLFDERSFYNGCIATIRKFGENDGEYFINGLGNKDWIWEEDDFDETYKDNKMESKKVKITLPKKCEVEKVETSVEDGYLVVEYTPKEKFEFKDGDVLSDGKYIVLYKETHEYGGICCYCYLYKDGEFEILKGDGRGYGLTIQYHLANKDERERLLNKIKEQGYIFNKKTKKLEKIRWMPLWGESYFYITNFLNIDEFSYDNDSIDLKMLEVGNCFQTKEDAQIYADKFKELLKNRP